MDYREMRDKFMHTNGTTAYETYSVIIPSFLLSYLSTLLTSAYLITPKNPKKCTITQFILEFVLIVVMTILIVTIFAPYVNEIFVSLMFTCLFVSFIVLRQKQEETTIKKSQKESHLHQFLTNGRSTINLISIVCILAVDFNVFPRRFAKTETYGYSLMDVGVGLYVYGNGAVAPEIRGHKDSFIKSVKNAIPLIVIGGARFFITKEIDYHVPVTEYGLHWNFFITLAAIKVLSSLILQVVPVKYALFIGGTVLFVHETLLQLGVAQFVFSNVERTTFLTANREGIASSLGYVALYFFAVGFGSFIDVKNESLMKNRWKTTGRLAISTATLMWATRVLEKNFGISRRLANSGFCIWIVFLGVLMMTLFFVTELAQKHIYKLKNMTYAIYSPAIFEAINYNGLTFFLFANILTGYINIMIDTLSVSQSTGLVIITAYMFVNCFVVFTLYYKGIRLRL